MTISKRGLLVGAGAAGVVAALPGTVPLATAAVDTSLIKMVKVDAPTGAAAQFKAYSRLSVGSPWVESGLSVSVDAKGNQSAMYEADNFAIEGAASQQDDVFIPQMPKQKVIQNSDGSTTIETEKFVITDNGH